MSEKDVVVLIINDLMVVVVDLFFSQLTKMNIVFICFGDNFAITQCLCKVD